jgi:hypothetical protein
MSWRTGYSIFIYTKKLKTSPAHIIEQYKRNRIEHLAKNGAFKIPQSNKDLPLNDQVGI